MASADTQNPSATEQPSDPAQNLSEELGVSTPPSPPPMTVDESQQPPEPSDDRSDEDVSASEDLDDIEKQMESRVWKFEGEFNVMRNDETIPQVFKAEYEQKPLSYFAFLEFSGLLAKKIDEAMASGLTIEDALKTAQGAVPFVVDGKTISAAVTQRDFQGADSLVQGLFKIASYVPDIMEEAQFIWLRVPRKDRPYLREIWGRARDEGGMTAEEGEEMLSIFIDQNYEELEDFFVERLPRIAAVAQNARKRMQKLRAERPAGSRRSRPWRRTAEGTPSQ